METERQATEQTLLLELVSAALLLCANFILLLPDSHFLSMSPTKWKNMLSSVSRRLEGQGPTFAEDRNIRSITVNQKHAFLKTFPSVKRMPKRNG